MSTLVKTKDLPLLRSVMEDFWNTDKFFDKPFFKGEVLPAVNIRESKNNYKLEVAAPGFKKGDFKITTEKGMLTISAETSSEQSEEKDNYTRKEFSCSSFVRTFTLPEDVKEDDIDAHYNDGLLKIELKKDEKSRPAKKDVKVK